MTIKGKNEAIKLSTFVKLTFVLHTKFYTRSLQ